MDRYTSKMLLAAIDEQHKGTYDFIYLPIDFKVTIVTKHNHCDHVLHMWMLILVQFFPFQNKCNVGYAFINMIDPQQIIPFYQVLFCP